MNEPHIYKHSPAASILILVVFFVLFAVIFLELKTESLAAIIPVAIAGIAVLLSVLIKFSSKAILSEDEIVVRGIFGEKALRWNEIHRVSGSGYQIKLHNFDEDVTVAPSPQLPGYEEIVEWIGRKRPDLFPPEEYSEIKRGFGFLIGMGVVFLMMIGFMAAMAFQFLMSPNAGFLVPVLFIFLMLMLLLWFIFSAAQSLRLEGRSMTLKYLFREKTLLANEVASIHLAYARTRNGKQYYISIQQANGRSMRISGLGAGLPIAYLVLKNWHARNG